MAEWPAQLPQNFLQQGLQVSPFDNAIPVDVESGEPMTRLRFTGDLSNIRGSIVTSYDGVSIFKAFWQNDLNRGTTRFTWRDPLTGNIVEFLFMSPPAFSNLGGDNWQVDMQLCMFA